MATATATAKDTPTAAQYRAALAASEQTALEALETLQQVHLSGDKARRLETLNKVQKQLVCDTARLITAKNAFKNECHDAAVADVDVVRKCDSAVSNPLLLKWQVQLSKNNSLWTQLQGKLRHVSAINLDALKESIDVRGMDEDEGHVQENWIDSLNVTPESIETLMWNKDPLPANSNSARFQPPDDAEEKIKQLVKESDVKKFKLVQLHDKYYERKIHALDTMEAKWSAELNRVKSFVSTDVGAMKLEMESKLQDISKEKSLDTVEDLVPDADDFDEEEPEEEDRDAHDGLDTHDVQEAQDTHDVQDIEHETEYDEENTHPDTPHQPPTADDTEETEHQYHEREQEEQAEQNDPDEDMDVDIEE